jgi:hypothetical protein
VGEIDRVTEGEVLTVTVATLDVTVTGVLELSFTCKSKLQMPSADRVPVETDGREVLVQLKDEPRSLNVLAPGASSSHWQV